MTSWPPCGSFTANGPPSGPFAACGPQGGHLAHFGKPCTRYSEIYDEEKKQEEALGVLEETFET